MPESGAWRAHVPKNGESNKWFGWASASGGPEEGAHVPTEVGCDLIASTLLPFESVVPALGRFFDEHPDAPKLGASKSNGFQAVNLLAAISPIGLTRASLNHIFSRRLPERGVGFRPSKDPIQLVNKVSQRGIADLRRELIVPGEGKSVVYQIPVPIGFTNHHLSVRTGHRPDDPQRSVEAVKAWLQRTFIDVPASKWQVGHRNPDLPDDARNAVMQPPGYNQSLRDRFIFDERGLICCPTAREYSERLREFVVSEAGARMILEALLREYPQLRDHPRLREDSRKGT